MGRIDARVEHRDDLARAIEALRPESIALDEWDAAAQRRVRDVVLDDAIDQARSVLQLTQSVAVDFEGDEGNARESMHDPVLLRREAVEDTRLLVRDVPTLGGDRRAIELPLGGKGAAREAQLDENACGAVLLHAALERLRDDDRRAGGRPGRGQHGRGVRACEQSAEARDREETTYE